MKLFLGAAVLWGVLGSTGQAAPALDDEAGMFGAPTPTGVAAEVSGSASVRDSGGLDTRTLGHDDFANGTVKVDPLEIGGTVFQQIYADFSAAAGPGSAPISAPLQADLFLDARPNDRIRAYVDARLLYDSTKNAQGQAVGSGADPFASALAGSSAAVSGTASNPDVLLDQAWISFDAQRTAFLTIGRQHVKWGTGHVWNPTDFLTTQAYNPLQPFDTRLGNDMVKAQVPLSGLKGTNVYALALLDNPEPASSVGQVGGAFRAETLLWGAEAGADAVARAGRTPEYGVDVSAPLGPLDFYSEAAFISGGGFPDYSFAGLPASGTGPVPLTSLVEVDTFQGPAVQADAGLSWDFPWKENRQATVGAEYFYNELGVSDSRLLPVLMEEGLYQGFYGGRNYGALYLTAEGPDEGKKTNYSLTNIANLSDASAVSRLDFTCLLLDYLTFGVWATVHYGTRGGELNFAFDSPAVTYQGEKIPAMDVPASPLELGMSLRLAY
jgi:hypothetical protein